MDEEVGGGRLVVGGVSLVGGGGVEISQLTRAPTQSVHDLSLRTPGLSDFIRRLSLSPNHTQPCIDVQRTTSQGQGERKTGDTNALFCAYVDDLTPSMSA